MNLLSTAEPLVSRLGVGVLAAMSVLFAPAVSAEQTPAAELAQLAQVYRTNDAAALRGKVDDPETPRHARAAARLLLARRAARQGDFDAMAREHTELGVVKTVRLFSREDNFGGTLLAEPTPVERAHLAGTPLPHSGHELHAGGGESVFDVGAQFHARDDFRTALAFVVHADKAVDAELHIDTTGQVVATVGGTEVLRDAGTRPLGLGHHSIALTLAQGPTAIFVRLGNREGPAQIRIRLTTPDGLRLPLETEASVEALRDARPNASRVRASPAMSVQRLMDTSLSAMSALAATPSSDGPDPLADALVVEAAVHTEAQAVRPARRDVWRAAMTLRLRIAATHDAGARAALYDLLAETGRDRVRTDATAAAVRLDEVLAADPTHEVARLALAELRLEQGLQQEATAHYRSVFDSAAPSDAGYVEAASYLRYEAEGAQEVDMSIVQRAQRSDFIPLLDVAIDAAEDRMQYALARRLVEKLRGLAPHHRAVRLYDERDVLRQSDVRAGEILTRLETTLRGHLVLEPQRHTLVRKLALLLHWRGAHDAAGELVNSHVQRFPRRAEAHATVGELASLRGDSDVALAAYQRAQLLQPQRERYRQRVAALLSPNQRGEAMMKFDAREAQSRPTTTEEEERGAAIVAHQVFTDVYDNGLYLSTERIAVRITDPDRARFMRQLTFPYAQDREALTVKEAYVLSASGARREPQDVSEHEQDGKVSGMYTDARYRVVDWGPLRPGDLTVVVVERRAIGAQNWFGDFFGVMQSPVHVLPTSVWEWVVRTPREVALHFNVRGMSDPAVEHDADFTVFRFEHVGHPGVRVEPSMRPVWDDAPYASVSTYNDWASLAAWYTGFVRDQLRLSEELRDAAKQAVANAKTDAAKAEALYNFVTAKTRYVGVELGVHGWKPYPMTEVMRRGYGDCKDMASLFVSLAATVGLPADLALVRTRDRGHLTDALPSMWHFNHAAVYLPSLKRFIDPTAEHLPWPHIPPLDQGAQALVVDVTGQTGSVSTTLLEIPTEAPQDNANASSYVLTLLPNGSAAVTGEEKFWGESAVGLRALFENKAQRETRLSTQIGEALAGARVESVTFSESPHTDPLGYGFRAQLPRYAQASADALDVPVSLYPQSLTARLAPIAQRERPAFFGSAWRVRNVVDVVPPTGWVHKAPPDVVIETAHFTFRQTFERRGAALRVTDEAVLKSRVIPLSDYAAFREACARADAAMARRIVFEKANPS